MTEQECIEWMEYLKNKGLAYDSSPNKRRIACDMAIKCIEKQIAKKPIKDGVGSFIRYWHCPICEEIIGIENKYCHKCGQKIDKSKSDWGNEDAE